MASTPNFNWSTPDNTGLVKNGALDIRTLGNAIDASMVDLKGGTTGQVLSKASNTDMDFTWATDASGIPATILDAKGDIIAATAADTASRLAVGTNGQVLTADSTTATGLKWATPAGGGGKVLQVLQDTANTEIDNSTTTYAATGLSQAITPSATTSKVLVMMTIPIHKTAESADNAVTVRILRGGTEIVLSTSQLLTQTALRIIGNLTFVYLDSPSTTSSTTYSVEFKNYSNNNRARVCSDNTLASLVLMEIGA